MSFNSQVIQSVFNSYSAFFKSKGRKADLSQLDDCKEKDDSITFALQRLRIILELVNKPGISKKQKKLFEEELKKILKELGIKKNQPKNKLDKILDSLMAFGEALGNFIMAILTGTADKIFTHEEQLAMQEVFDKFLAMLIQNRQQQPAPRYSFFQPRIQLQTKLILENFVLEINQRLANYNQQILNQIRNIPALKPPERKM